MENRFERGFIAGVIGGLIMNSWSFISGYIRFTDIRIVDWSGIMFFGHTPPFTLIETIVALGLQLGFSGFLGVVFAFLIPMITKQNLYFKSLVFGAAIWFFIYGVITLFQVPGTVPISVGTVVSNLLSALLFGLGTAFYLKQFSSVPALRVPKITAVPAMKPIRKNDKPDHLDKDKNK